MPLLCIGFKFLFTDDCGNDYVRIFSYKIYIVDDVEIHYSLSEFYCKSASRRTLLIAGRVVVVPYQL